MDVEAIDRDSGVPVWRQLTRILRRQIEAGARTGRLPSETGLAGEFGVAQATVRKALAALRDDGLIETWAGAGSRVLPPGERKPPGG